jgi:DNA-binding MarR family transcriptional regulator
MAKFSERVNIEQMAILFYIAGNLECDAGDVSAELGIPYVTTTKIVSMLERPLHGTSKNKSLVVKKPNATDARRSIFLLTEEGTKYIQELLEAM